ncbi:hypothetical protein QLR68_14375 [Micromonospora sp. DH15]|nr:hypothetical protein [Micromonospora sp. DH15]
MTSGRGLEDAVWALLHEALHHYRDHPWAADRLRHELARLEEPLRVAVAGGWRSGKSTLLNAIMGEQVAPVAGVDGEDTFTWYEDGPAPGATAWSTDGVPQELAVTRSALVAVEGLLRAEPGLGTGELLGAVERIVAGAHEFAELRLLAALRAGRVGFAAEPAAEAQRLVGGEGTAPAARLGAEHDATARQLWELAVDAQWRWRERAEDPTLRLVQRRGAEVVARSCEGLIVELAGPPRRSTPA